MLAILLAHSRRIDSRSAYADLTHSRCSATAHVQRSSNHVFDRIVQFHIFDMELLHRVRRRSPSGGRVPLFGREQRYEGVRLVDL